MEKKESRRDKKALKGIVNEQRRIIESLHAENEELRMQLAADAERVLYPGHAASLSNDSAEPVKYGSFWHDRMKQS